MIKLQLKLPQALISRGFTRRTVLDIGLNSLDKILGHHYISASFFEFLDIGLNSLDKILGHRYISALFLEFLDIRLNSLDKILGHH